MLPNDPGPLPGPLRRRPLAVVAAALGVVLLLGLYTLDRRTTPVDVAVDGALRAVPDVVDPVATAVVRLGGPVSMVAVAVLLAALCLRLAQPRAAAVCIVAPLVTAGVVGAGLQPMFDRPSALAAGGDAYPSTHSAVSATVAVVLVALLARDGVLGHRMPPLARRLLTGLALAVPAALSLALMWRHDHYVTDVLGGVAVAIAVVAGTAGVLTASGCGVSALASRALQRVHGRQALTRADRRGGR